MRQDDGFPALAELFEATYGHSIEQAWATAAGRSVESGCLRWWECDGPGMALARVDELASGWASTCEAAGELSLVVEFGGHNVVDAAIYPPGPGAQWLRLRYEPYESIAVSFEAPPDVQVRACNTCGEAAGCQQLSADAPLTVSDGLLLEVTAAAAAPNDRCFRHERVY